VVLLPEVQMIFWWGYGPSLTLLVFGQFHRRQHHILQIGGDYR
jgi:hypothetical protein